MNGPAKPQSRRVGSILWAAALAACVAALVFQTRTISRLRAQLQLLDERQPAAALDVQQSSPAGNEEIDLLRAEHAELFSLRSQAHQLREQLRDLTKVQAESRRVQEQPPVAFRNETLDRVTAEEVTAFKQARARSERIQCISHLKQIALAARIWANDHQDIMPPDFLTMSKELNHANVLICPSDPARAPKPDPNGEPISPPTNPDKFDAKNISYVMDSPGVSTADPTRVFASCPFHRTVALMDGSVLPEREQ